MNENTPQMLEFSGIKMLNRHSAQAVIDEVYHEDCYRFNEIPEGSTVIDVGAFYGEFSLICAKLKGCMVSAFEPSPVNFQVLKENRDLNPEWNQKIVINKCAVSDKIGTLPFYHRPDHPAGSSLNNYTPENSTFSTVGVVPITNVVEMVRVLWEPKHITVKLDCEGSEVEIFKDESWIDRVHIVTMEWHNFDGHIYKEILERHGFDVELEGSGPKPRPAYDKSMAGGLLFARKK